MPSLGLTGLSQAVSGPYTGKLTNSKVLSSKLPGNLGLHGVSQVKKQDSGAITLTLPSATMSLEANSISTNIPSDRRHLGLHGVAEQPKQFENKGQSSLTITLPSAAMVMEAEELEGTDYTIIPDGAAIQMIAGQITVVSVDGTDYDSGRSNIYMKVRRFGYSTAERNVQIAGMERRIDIQQITKPESITSGSGGPGVSGTAQELDIES